MVSQRSRPFFRQHFTELSGTVAGGITIFKSFFPIDHERTVRAAAHSTTQLQKDPDHVRMKIGE